MIQETKLVGCLVQLALAGTIEATPTAGNVGVGFIPDNSGVDASSSAIWMPLGTVASWEPKVSSKAIEIYGPKPGTLTLTDKRRTQFKREITITVTDSSNAMWLAINYALGITSPRTGTIGQYVPLTSGTIKGWIKAQFYNQDTNSQEVAEQVWGEMMVSAGAFGNDKNIEYKIDFTQLWSALNTATGA